MRSPSGEHIQCAARDTDWRTLQLEGLANGTAAFGTVHGAFLAGDKKQVHTTELDSVPVAILTGQL